MKPPYRIPSMSEIAALPPNGFNVVSTFSGCGGSCTGFKMAGYKVLWASEFVPAAQETYRANHHGTILDTRDIRQIKPEEIKDAIGNVEIDVLDVEGLAHVRAARTQQRRHLGLVRLPLEPGGNRLRRRRHLTERKRSRKDLDQEGFHRGGPAETG